MTTSSTDQQVTVDPVQDVARQEPCQTAKDGRTHRRQPCPQAASLQLLVRCGHGHTGSLRLCLHHAARVEAGSVWCGPDDYHSKLSVVAVESL